MANINRFRVVWSGISGGTGISTFYTDTSLPVNTFLTALRAFFQSFPTFLPTGVILTYPSAVDTLNATNGALVASLPATPPAVTSGSGAGGYSAPAGVQVKWNTGLVVDGHRVSGRTFLVPINGNQVGTTGMVLPSCQSTVGTAAAALIAACGTSFVVWHRPKLGAGGAVIRNGVSVPIISGEVPIKPVVLRGRRD